MDTKTIPCRNKTVVSYLHLIQRSRLYGALPAYSIHTFMV